jgi:biopolymer transport protein ExbD
MAGSAKFDDDEISGINVTPLVDVVLVLLVIFMITAPTLYQNALNVQLPQAKTGEEQQKSIMQIGIDHAGTIMMDGKSYTVEQLVDYVKVNHPISAILLADRKVEHGKVITVIDTLKSQGIQKFSFGVEKQ